MGKYSFNQYFFNITDISINNFRVFEKDTSFKIAPITILTGTNSSGKSSFIKALKLLVRSYEKNGLRKLALMETDLKLGGFKSMINTLSHNQQISFYFKITGFSHFPESLQSKEYEVYLVFDSLGLIQLTILDESGLVFEQAGDFGMEYKKPIKSFIRLEESLLNKTLIEKKLSGISKENLKLVYKALMRYLQSNVDLHDSKSRYIDYHYVDYKFDVITERISRVLNGISNVGIIEKVKGFYETEEGESIDYIREQVVSNQSTFGDLLPKSVAGKLPKSFLEESFTSEYLVTIPDVTDFVHKNLFFEIFSKYEFIDGVRASQELIYTNENNPDFYKTLDSFYNSTGTSFIDSLEYWLVNKLKILQLPENIKLKEIFEIQQFQGFGYIITVLQNGINLGLSGLGYGISQLLPIILKLIINYDAGKTYVIEEPESNLHPALQSQLADLFQSYINGRITSSIDQETGLISYSAGRSFISQNRLIVETHSEYLIRKLQFFTAKGDLEPDKTIIYYFNPVHQILRDEEQIKSININTDGSLSDDFGTGFFDEADNIALDLFLMNKGQKN